MDLHASLESQSGKYEITRLINFRHSIFLANYTAKNSSVPRTVALKQIFTGNLTEEQKWKEGRIMMRISESFSNEHIIELIECFPGKDGLSEHMFISMKYYSSGDLRGIIKKKRESGSKFEKDTIYNYIYQIADGIAELHCKHKIVHRDLKPENILIDKKRGKEILKIADFGTSKIKDKTITNDARITRGGSELYMAPEQLIGKPHKSCDYPVDIWAVGIIFYELSITPNEWSYDNCGMVDNMTNKCKKVILPESFSKEVINFELEYFFINIFRTTTG